MIRTATKDDLDGIVSIGKAFFEEGDYSEFMEYSEENTRATIAAYIDNPDFHVLIKDRKGEVTALLIMVVMPYFFSKDTLVASELFWYVAEKERNSATGYILLRRGEDWAKGKGASVAHTMCIETTVPDLAEKMFIRMGYKKMERHFMRNL